MTMAETIKVMGALQLAYPSYYRDYSEADAAATAKFWQEMFADDSYNEVAAAVRVLVATRVEGYPPTIGAIKEKLAQLRNTGDMDAQEAWALAAKAAAGNLAWERLPKPVQRAIGSQQILRDWGMIETSVFNTVIYSQFVKAYSTRQRREQEMAAIPENVRALLRSVGDRLSLEADNG